MEIGTHLFLQSFLQHLLLETDHMLSGQSALLDGNHRNGRESELKRELTHDGGTEPVGAQQPQPSLCTTTQLSGLLVTEHFSLSIFLQEPIGEVSQTPSGHQHSVELYREAQYCSFLKEFSHTGLVQILTSTFMFLIAGSHLQAGIPLPVIQCTKFPPCRLTSAPQFSLAAGLGRNKTQRACSIFPTAFCIFLQHLIKCCTRFIVKGRWSNW